MSLKRFYPRLLVNLHEVEHSQYIALLDIIQLNLESEVQDQGRQQLSRAVHFEQVPWHYVVDQSEFLDYTASQSKGGLI